MRSAFDILGGSSMRLEIIVAALVGSAVVFTGGAHAPYGGVPDVAPAFAQDGKAAQPKGVTSRGLVGSTGPIAAVAAGVPAALTGQIVELTPGGQTGRQRNLVPSFLYVIEGTLVIDTDGGVESALVTTALASLDAPLRLPAASATSAATSWTETKLIGLRPRNARAK